VSAICGEPNLEVVAEAITGAHITAHAHTAAAPVTAGARSDCGSARRSSSRAAQCLSGPVNCCSDVA
jgi:hypothetical protein